MRVFGPTQPPYGFVRFCDSTPEACTPQTLDESRFQPTPERLSELDEINRGINRAITPATDAEIYGVSEYWTLPSEKGDCEDYALLKQKLLEQRGWPSSALLMTVVRDEKGEGHAVLTARTAQGDFILDNKIDEVKLWNKSSYQFVSRQSYVDPRAWVSLDASDETAPAAIAGVREDK
ncbi:MAG TPA: transglutaminase-like cysteine peptidase [Hyphomicrobiaceae bacterium]|nr:transglutaminase-like cysteine peptidase [Hyphomicrobiaceae bacterium]